MCERKPSEINPGENQRCSFCDAIFKQSLLPSKLIIILFILLIIPTAAKSQDYSVFNLRNIIKAVKVKYNLSVKDINLLLPLIKQENFEILAIYLRLDVSQNGYSETLWDNIITRRYEFETRIKGKFTKHQESILQAVRGEMEAQILSLLVESYISFLGDYLELDHFQLEGIGDLLNGDYKRKHQLIIRKSSNVPLLQNEIEKINRQTESGIEKIISPAQLRLYLMLSDQNEYIAE